MKKIYYSGIMIPLVNNSFCSSTSTNNLLDQLKNKLKNIKIEKNNIVEKSNNHTNINADIADLKNVTDGNKDEKIIKKESIVDVTEYFKALKEYCGEGYKDKKTFNDGFDELSNKFTDDFKDKADYYLPKIIKYLVIEGTVKVPKKEKNLYNLITNCINNNNKFYVYFDNLNKNLKYDNDFRPRNKKAKKEINLNDVNQGIVDKHKDKELIILYVLNKGEEHVFTTEE